MDLTYLSATNLAGMIRARRVGCLEALDHFITRVERLDGPINAVVVRDFDRARARARALDSATDRSAPLFGVPMTVKESFDIRGLPTTRGHLSARDHRAGESGIAVQRLQNAGAVVFGKTNVPVDLADWQSYNPVYGATSNPWNLAHTPGGSSGGSSAALAAGFTPLELGTDIGGSVRVPAHFCGVFGHKPTWALCPNTGDPATTATAPTDIATLGPMALTAADLAVVLDLLALPDPAATTLSFTVPPPASTTLRGLRVAIWSHQPGRGTERETTEAIEDLAHRLAREGAVVEWAPSLPVDPTEAFHLYLQLLDAAWSVRNSDALLAAKRQLRDSAPATDTSADVIMARSVDMPHRTWLMLQERRQRMVRAWNGFFRDHDVLLCPAFGTSALPHMQRGETWERKATVDGQEIPYNDLLFWPGVIGGFHLPATIAPIGVTRLGLPLGVQIVGPIHGDRTTIAMAGMLEHAFGGFRPPVMPD